MDEREMAKENHRGSNPIKAQIILHLANGTTVRGTAELYPAQPADSKGRVTRTTERSASPHSVPPRIDFSMPLRPFVKTYGSKLTGGPRKLTLLISHMAGGKTEATVARADVEKNWSRMQALMGARYNGAYDTRARDEGWICSPKPGTFALRAGWEAIFE